MNLLVLARRRTRNVQLELASLLEIGLTQVFHHEECTVDLDKNS